MAILGYARVSTLHQSPQMQLAALEQGGAQRIWTDQMSGMRDDRPELANLVATARAAGRHPGGPGLTVDTIAAARALDEAGTPRAQIVRTLRISRSSVYQCLGMAQ